MTFLLKNLYSKKTISKRGYSLMIAAFWIYTILWLGALIAVYYFWNVSLVTKAIASIPFIILTPAITDLFRSYEKYVKNGDKGI